MSMRCSRCNISYPSDKKRCPGCQNMLWDCTGDKHDLDWKEQSDRLARRVKRDGIDRLPNVICSIVERDEQLYVASEILEDAGYLDLETGDILKLNDEYYECSSAVFYGLETPGWWITFIPVDGVFTNATDEEIAENLAAQATTEGE